MAENIIDDFKKQGYVVLKNVVSESNIQEIKAQINKIMDYQVPDDVKEFNLDQKWLWLKCNRPVLKSHAYDVLGKLDGVMSLFFKEKLLSNVKEIFGTPVIIDKIQIRVDDCENTRVLPMHQERGQISKKEITVWIPLQDITMSSGGVKIIPGSHKDGDLGVKIYDHDKMFTGVHEKHLEGREVQHVLMNCGDILIFHWDLIHGSFLNTSNQIRFTAIARFNSTDDVPYLTNEDAPLSIPKNIQLK